MLLGDTVAVVLGEGFGGILDNNSTTTHICYPILLHDTDAQLLVICDHVCTFCRSTELLDPISISQ